MTAMEQAGDIPADLSEITTKACLKTTTCIRLIRSRALRTRSASFRVTVRLIQTIRICRISRVITTIILYTVCGIGTA